MRGMYEAAPGVWLMNGVTLEQNRDAWDANYTGDPWIDEFVDHGPHELDERRVWRTREGRDIPYDELDPGHLRNIKAMIVRNNRANSWPTLMNLP